MALDPAIEACILAGGLSSRMGQDKARLRLGGKTFLTHIRAVLKGTGWPVRVIRRDLVPACGPLGGVYTALRTTQADAVLFLSCDMPLVTAALLGRVQARLTPKEAAVFVQHEELGFPFLIRRTALPMVEKRLAAGQFALRSLARALNSAVVRVRSDPEAHALVNINTPEEYEAARQWWRKRERNQNL